MNRVKFWVFTLLVVALGYLVVHLASSARRAEAVAALDARLASAAAHVGASTSAAGREAGAASAFVARDEALVAALHAPTPTAAAPAPAPPPRTKKGKKAPPPPPPPAAKPDFAAEDARIREASRAALEKAEKALGFDLPQGTQVIAVTQAILARRPDETDVGGLLRSALGNQVRRAIVRQAGALFYGAARPAGEGACVAVLVPLDEAWARRLATAAGVDFTLAVPDVKAVTTTRGVDPALLQGATKLAGAGDVGRPAPVDVSFGPLKLPPLPQPFAGGAPIRARAVPLEGVKGGYVVASIPAAAAVNAPAVFLWRTAAGLVLVLLLGLVVGFFVRSTEPTPQVPEPLYAAAVKIEKGDFSARAPQLAGKLGTIGAALNRAAEIAGPALAARGAPAAPATTDEWFQAGLRPTDDAARAPAPAVPAAAPPPRAPTIASVAAPVSAPGPELDEETHWQQVFQDFLRTRSSCGEGTEGLTFEKFRQKLEGNKAQLVSKYACKTVRFQVYVKDGKAALKATPVK